MKDVDQMFWVNDEVPEKYGSLFNAKGPKTSGKVIIFSIPESKKPL